ncbi:hypothetical protein AC579_622 [Pseudocercospora musae]|uniref:Uncharacterized protein n=1 Tax=Pseudocercospora musae TaxID=113226 RepID=A0A139HQG6_9PEZI|nr:hypothetical protein AC579_622 [Pseudocercospora musae]
MEIQILGLLRPHALTHAESGSEARAAAYMKRHNKRQPRPAVKMVRDFTKVSLDNINPQADSDLMGKLSAEIRNQIWDLVFESPTVVVRSRLTPNTPPPGILLSCKQAYYEAIKLHWTNSTFYIFGPWPHRWFTRIGRRRRELLTDARIDGHGFLRPAYKRWTPLGPPDVSFLGVSYLVQQVQEVTKWLEDCSAGRRGVAPGVIKVGLLFAEHGCNAPVTKVWTADPNKTGKEWAGKCIMIDATEERAIESRSTLLHLQATHTHDDRRWRQSEDVSARRNWEKRSVKIERVGGMVNNARRDVGLAAMEQIIMLSINQWNTKLLVLCTHQLCCIGKAERSWTIWNLADFTKVDVKSADSQEDSALMQMRPPEIRNRIYKLALDDVVTLDIGRHDRVDHKKGLPPAPALLVTCKQIHAEAIKLYWVNSTFRFPLTTADKFKVWLLKIKRRRRELLRDVQLDTRWLWMIFSTRISRGSLLTELDLREAAESGERQLCDCQAGKRGVANGVMKTSVMVPGNGKLTAAGIIPKIIWTSTSCDEAKLVMKSRSVNEF